ncbi:MAG: ABC transporter permease, partial [Bacilli bacterium]
MKDIQHVWKKRSGLFWKEAVGYLRYVFNSGFLVFLMFTFIAGGYYYSRMINDIPKSFQSEWIITAILSFLVTFGSVRTFLKQADYVFLLPLEWKMAPYFRSSFLYSYVFRAFIVLFAFGLLQPLYNHRFSEGGLQTGYIFGMLLTLTFINLLAS